MPLKLTRLSAEPVLTPRKHIAWEQDAVLNTAVVLKDGKIHLIYRGVHHPGGRDANGDWIQFDSCLGHAVSDDGIHFECADKPVLSHGEMLDGKIVMDPQDPRITQIGDTYYMAYCDWDLCNCWSAIASSKDLIHWSNLGASAPFERFGMNKNSALFSEKIGGRYAMIFRPEPPQCVYDATPFSWDLWTKNPDILGGMRLSFSDDLLTWSYEEDCFLMPREGKWDNLKIGIAGPPIKTEQGWLTVYHGVDQNRTYRLGVALLDLNDPSIVIKRQDEPILDPEMPWEKKGDVDGVVFSCGGFLKDGELWVYYCGADTVIGAARASAEDVRKFLS